MNDIQVVVPMTGHGSRFKAAGYQRLKPFIEVQGAPMIEWVTRMFPGAEGRTIFICRQEHLDNLEYMRPELRRINPEARIVELDNWQKLGPVNDLLRAAGEIDDDAPVLVSYCDFYMHWDFETFVQAVTSSGVDGAVPCYSGFHPHLLPAANLYASCKVDDEENLIEIREKFSWTKDKTQSRHSPGVYYFRTGKLLKYYCSQLVERGQSLNGEYYVSLVYNAMLEDDLRIWCPVNVPRFCQWGTPEDLEEYLFWVNKIRMARSADQ